MKKIDPERNAAMKTAEKIAYSTYKSHNRELGRMDWDACWEAYTRDEWLPDHYVAQYRESKGYRGYHANSRTVKTLRAWVRGLRRRMRELDLAATGDNTFCDSLGI